MEEKILQCPKCKRSYDRSWRVCLFCGVQLRESAEEHNGTGYDKFPGSRPLIVIFSIAIMLLTPFMILLLYLSYVRAWDASFIRHKFQQLKNVVVFQEEEQRADQP